MKKIFFTLISPLVIVFVLGSCRGSGSDPEPQKTPEELAILDLTSGSSQVWTIAGGGSVTRDGRTETALFANFEFTLASSGSNKTYQTTNSNNLFDSNGTWTFEGGNFDRLRLSGTRPAAGRDITFTRTADNLILTFNVPMPSGRIEERVEAIAGNYIFTLKRR
ncbi:hypothetical protein [Mongoliitalea lutea]|uniref:Lipocalin-like domain-containing protein n=1 Tax=Mongoliitalea lutea TaxID=849756 RepID=A0A8J3CYY7_9BACT|nr:hypothetical protein [Mongoliitalea lutea]GHB42432.1 hypothetical protein GCM10008106_24260 [Mongoliitalea lutea]